MPRRPKPRKRVNGSVVQTGATWRIRWRERGRRRSASFADKETADRVLARILGDLAAGRGGLEVERPPAPALSKLAGAWIERRQTSHRAWRDDKHRMNKHLLPSLGHLRPNDVTPSELRRFVETKLAEGLSSTTVTKSGHGRIVPIGDTLARVLTEWRLASGGSGQLFVPKRPGAGGHPGAPPRFVSLGRVHEQLRAGLKACDLPEDLTLYDCGRATFASQWVLGGGSMEKLAKILGHASVTTTEASYSRMRPDMIRPAALATFDVDLSQPVGAAVIDLAAHRIADGGTRVGPESEIAAAENANS